MVLRTLSWGSRTLAKYLQGVSTVETSVECEKGQAFPAWHCPVLKNLQGTCEVSAGAGISTSFRCQFVAPRWCLTLRIRGTSWSIKCSETHCTSMSRAPVGNLVWEAVWNGHWAIAIGVCRSAIWPKVCRLPMLYAMAIIAVSGRVLLLRRIVEDCLVRWRAWQEVRQGS